uniref:Uncharacterized protein n=1 Tax=Haptolina ericina TaxID=156174 RepID=A0A7S3ABK2_9EUKA|mmetsp:Transcript_10615/g.24369  ORF Transcript_10615/g.24369 Transcript_10615/m.24369 type:complete len:200 (+) Transcript_10615:3-602(+)
MLCDRLEANEPGSELETDRGLADEDVSSDDGSDTGQTRGGTLDVIGLVKSRRPRITSTEHTFSPPASPLLQSDVDEYASYFSASGGLLQPPSFLEGASQSDTAQAPPALVADTGKAVRFALDEGETQGSRIVAECYVRMVFLKGGELTQPPPAILESISTRRDPPTETFSNNAGVRTRDWDLNDPSGPPPLHRAATSAF